MNSRLRDNCIYLAVAFLAVCAVVAPIIYYEAQDEDLPAFPVVPIWMVSSTAIVFGYTLHEYRKHARRVRFWVVLISLVIVHVISWGVFVNSVDRLPLLLMGLFLAPEGFVVLLIMDFAVVRKPRVTPTETE